jgi:hypothetical protein
MFGELFDLRGTRALGLSKMSFSCHADIRSLKNLRNQIERVVVDELKNPLHHVIDCALLALGWIFVSSRQLHWRRRVDSLLSRKASLVTLDCSLPPRIRPLSLLL